MDAYLFAGALLVIALVVGRTRRGIKARDVADSILINGDAHGAVTQLVAKPSLPPAKAAPDRVAWVIALLGVIIALVQLGRDLLKP